MPLTQPVAFIIAPAADAAGKSAAAATAPAAATADGAAPAADGAATADGGAAAATSAPAAAAAAAAPAVELSAAEVASAKKWSAKVLLLSGMPQQVGSLGQCGLVWVSTLLRALQTVRSPCCSAACRSRWGGALDGVG